MGGSGGYSGYGSINSRPPLASSVNGAQASQREIEIRPISDITGQSHLIDSDLGPANSILRQQISHHIKDIAGHFSGSDAVSVTKELFGD